MGFAEGLRALMRQDPDIIMVGEIRDLATAEMAIQAALTGHLVFSTLHTNDAASAITRLADLGVPQLPDRGHRDRRAGAAPGAHAVPGLQGARRGHDARDAGRSGQALAPVGRRAALQARGLPGMPPHRLPRPRRPVRAAADDRRRPRRVHPQLDSAALRRQAVKDGMRPLRLAGAMKVAEGVTTLEEVLRSTPSLDA
jgi:general secretion pathway protein E